MKHEYDCPCVGLDGEHTTCLEHPVRKRTFIVTIVADDCLEASVDGDIVGSIKQALGNYCIPFVSVVEGEEV